MPFQRILWPLFGTALVVVAYRSWGWTGVAFAAGGMVMWALLQFNRMVQVLKKTAERPIGHVGSAVMLHSRLKTGQTLLQVVGISRALGKLQSPPETQPEVFVWTDTGGSSVTCEFRAGKLVGWSLFRPPEVPESPPPAAP
jgi:hypothetical protein